MATKQLTDAQKLMLEQAAKGPILFEKLDGYGRRVAGILEDDELLTTVGANVEITEEGRVRVNARRVHANKVAKAIAKANGEPVGRKANGNGHAEAEAKAPIVPPWFVAARKDLEERHRKDFADLDRLAGIRA